MVHIALFIIALALLPLALHVAAALVGIAIAVVIPLLVLGFLAFAVFGAYHGHGEYLLITVALVGVWLGVDVIGILQKAAPPSH